jgi:hypothetical protein
LSLSLRRLGLRAAADDHRICVYPRGL